MREAAGFVADFRREDPGKFKKKTGLPLATTARSRAFQAHFGPACEAVQDAFQRVREWADEASVHIEHQAHREESGVLFYHSTQIMAPHAEQADSLRAAAEKHATPSVWDEVLFSAPDYKQIGK